MLQRLINNDVQTNLLALSPFFLIISSFSVALYTGLTVIIGFLITVTVISVLRNYIPLAQRRVVVLVIGSTVILLLGMLLSAENYSYMENTGLFFPLLLINSLLLTRCESCFSEQEIKSVFFNTLKTSVIILIFLLFFGLVRELLETASFFASSAGCFLIAGLLFAACNLLSKKHDY